MKRFISWLGVTDTLRNFRKLEDCSVGWLSWIIVLSGIKCDWPTKPCRNLLLLQRQVRFFKDYVF